MATTSNLPKLLFIGAGNIAQSIMKGIVKATPECSSKIYATAPSDTNLSIIRSNVSCNTILLDKASTLLDSFKPDYAFLCYKPQVFASSLNKITPINGLIKSLPNRCILLSVISGVSTNSLADAYSVKKERVVRIMVNTAAEFQATSVFHYSDMSCPDKLDKLNKVLSLIGKTTIKLNDESLIDVSTGICGSGIAFFYEMIQATSDVGVKNGLNRKDSILAAAQLAVAAGTMVIEKGEHPCKLRDDVTSPAGTTIYGLNTWHDQRINPCIGNAFQASIDRAKTIVNKK